MVRPGPRPQDKPLTRSPFDWLVGLRYVKLRWFTRTRPCSFVQCHPLILDGLCACTFYPVFKEPSLPPPCGFVCRLGNLPNLRSLPLGCQQENQLSLIFFSLPAPPTSPHVPIGTTPSDPDSSTPACQLQSRFPARKVLKERADGQEPKVACLRAPR